MCLVLFLRQASYKQSTHWFGVTRWVSMNLLNVQLKKKKQGKQVNFEKTQLITKKSFFRRFDKATFRKKNPHLSHMMQSQSPWQHLPGLGDPSPCLIRITITLSEIEVQLQ